MAGGKPQRNGHEDSKLETPNAKDKDAHGQGSTVQLNGKMRRVASSAGSLLREATNAATLAAVAPTSSTSTGAPEGLPGVS